MNARLAEVLTGLHQETGRPLAARQVSFEASKRRSEDFPEFLEGASRLICLLVKSSLGESRADYTAAGFQEAASGVRMDPPFGSHGHVPEAPQIPLQELDAHIPSEYPRARADEAVQKHKRQLRAAQLRVAYFLHQNNFEIDANCKREGFFYSYPLHEAVKQNDAYISSKLLLFGAKPWLKDGQCT